MNMRDTHAAVSLRLCALTIIALPYVSSGQGPLTPPDVPAPTMKTLDQMRPETPIAGGNSTVTIDPPGSYYLTGNIAVEGGNGVVITADNVTLDLSGFTISSSAASPGGSGILISDIRSGVHIRNGHIQGTLTYNSGSFSGGSFDYGILADGNCQSCRVSGVSVVGVNEGIRDFPIALSVESCEVQTIRLNGITAGAVSHCRARNCGAIGIFARTALHCVVEGNSSQGAILATLATNCYGITIGSGTGVGAFTAQDCYGESDSGIGLSANMAQNCYGYSTSGIGLNAFAATNSYGQSSTNNGIHASTANGCYGTSTSNRGISCDVVTASIGYSGGGSFGINAAHIATNSYGYSFSGIGLASYIANSCRGENNAGPSVAASFKYNMP